MTELTERLQIITPILLRQGRTDGGTLSMDHQAIEDFGVNQNS